MEAIGWGWGAEWFEVNKVLLVKRTWLKGGGVQTKVGKGSMLKNQTIRI